MQFQPCPPVVPGPLFGFPPGHNNAFVPQFGAMPVVPQVPFFPNAVGAPIVPPRNPPRRQSVIPPQPAFANFNQAQAQPRRAAPNNAGLCIHCGVLPRSIENGRAHPFCSRSCGRAHSAMHPPKIPVAGHGICGLPGCQAPVFVDASGRQGTYCTMRHKRLAENQIQPTMACLICRSGPAAPSAFYCGPNCESVAMRQGPIILEIPPGTPKYTSVEQQFNDNWKHPGSTIPVVRKVYKIVCHYSITSRYTTYRAKIEAETNLQNGNECRRWHGTTRQCNIGDNGRIQMCSSSACGVCGIIRSSFLLKKFGAKNSWGRFGRGLYTSSVSSKSNDYSANGSASPYKALLLNLVVVGSGYKIWEDCPQLQAPPLGYHSILGEVGGSLNYDETVVYNEEAIMPSYLVMYDA
ncbi:hypothetical protein JAAARDRAFT_183991 [Jaapia argillacea MUCL 33604]|uniref:PARP catalytic domain-containing protein n=1 Tax=Jaapia argillacea MUCL 33604 TaxID=933084 RepID=A0A067PFZ2_9AGAM|nr:hypothetical protein JAAARDRAFT_183991 [Jaapia argillacea MUCL 33604]